MRVGFLGAGLIATHHSKSIRHSGIDVQRAGVFDPDRDRAERFAAASGHQVCDSAEQVLDGCDAIYICTWTSEHRRLVEAAVRRDLAVFCEKPLATTLADAAAMTAAVEAAGVTNQVGLVLRHSPAFVWAAHLVAEAGRPMAFVLRDDQYIPTQGMYGSDWRGDVTRAGAGTMLEHSIHDIDVLAFVIGAPVGVSARSAEHHGLTGIEDVMAVTVTTGNGAIGTLTSVWHDNLARPSLRRLEVFCAERHVVVDGDDWLGPVTWTDSDGSGGTLEGRDLIEETAALIDGHPNPDAGFLRAAVAGGAATPDFGVALDAHRVVDAIYRSAQRGGDHEEVR